MDENQPLAQLTVEQTPQQWCVSTGDTGRRLDAFVSKALPQCTRREIIAWIAAGTIRINGRVSAKGAQVRAGDIVTLTPPVTLRPNPHLPVQFLHVDESIVALHKPSGIPSVALRHDETESIANFLLAHFPEMTTVSARQLEAGVVHRLDTATSGLLLAARTPAAYAALRHQFTSQTVHKQYLALVHGHVSQSGTRRSILAPTGPRGQRMREVPTGNGQAAQTHYVPVTRFPHQTLIRVTIPTGVRHQIRVHLAALGHPIVGDGIYGNPKDATRLCLHAEALALRHPQTGAHMQLACPLPEDFQVAMQQVTGVRLPSADH